ARAIDGGGILVITRDERARGLHGRLGDGDGDGDVEHQGGRRDTREHRPHCSDARERCQTMRVDSCVALFDARRVLAVGVQTWGTDLAALRRYWAAADALGYARVTYGDGLWDFTHDGWTLLAALALETRRCRIGPAVTYAFDAAAHHVSWLAKRAVAIAPLSDGRLDVRLAVGAEAPGVANAWRRHGIRYPPTRERLDRLEATIDALRRLWTGGAVSSPSLGLEAATVAPLPVQRP